MTVHLPLLAKHEREHTYCAYCPKLCRFSCPVSTVEGRETTTPWGKMTSVHHAVKGNLPLDPAHAATWYACSGCERCTEFCAHGNNVSSTLAAARSEAVRNHIAPPAATDVIERHAARESYAASKAEEIFGDVPRTAPREYAYVPGCTAVVQAAATARAGLAVTRALCGDDAGVEASACCGLPLLEAGDQDGFVRAATAYLARFSQTRTAVFHDPGCLHALRVTAAAHGVRSRTKLLHITELAAQQLERFATRPREGIVRYHDPCRLGRGLGIYEAPRLLLAHILGEPPAEFSEHRERSECSGAGGQLPRIHKQTSKRIAVERVRDHMRHGGGTLITACPAAAHAMAKAGESAVMDIVSVMHGALV